MKHKNLKYLLGFILIVLFSNISLFAQSDWRVDETKAKIQNPVKADAQSLKEGQTLFMANCKTCHGVPGKNNGLPLVPKPTDMSNAAFLSLNSDGALFAKMTEGKGTMPTFKAVLSATKRWQIVNYIRSFDANKKADASVELVKKKVGLTLIPPFKISITYDSLENKVSALVEGTSKEGNLVPASNVEVSFFIDRYFGDLPIGEIGALTNAYGILVADIPVDLPGGENGKAIAYAKLSDSDAYGDLSAKTEVNVKPVEIINLKDKRSLWTVRVMAPWWLIFTYFGILFGVWGTLGYVVLQLFKLKKAGA